MGYTLGGGARAPPLPLPPAQTLVRPPLALLPLPPRGPLPHRPGRCPANPPPPPLPSPRPGRRGVRAPAGGGPGPGGHPTAGVWGREARAVNAGGGVARRARERGRQRRAGGADSASRRPVTGLRAPIASRGRSAPLRSPPACVRPQGAPGPAAAERGAARYPGAAAGGGARAPRAGRPPLSAGVLPRGQVSLPGPSQGRTPGSRPPAGPGPGGAAEGGRLNLDFPAPVWLFCFSNWQRKSKTQQFKNKAVCSFNSKPCSC